MVERLTYKTAMGDYGSTREYDSQQEEILALRNALGKYEDIEISPEIIKKAIPETDSMLDDNCKGENIKIKQVEFTFENCDSVIIPGEYIEKVCLDGFRECTSGNYCGIHKMMVCEDFYIEISPAADVLYKPFGVLEPDGTQFSRVTEYDDITQIYVEYNNGESRLYYAYWHGDDDYVNPAQHSYVSNNGYLYLIISHKLATGESKISDYYDKDLVDSAEYADERKCIRKLDGGNE